MQPIFSKSLIFSSLALAALILLAQHAIGSLHAARGFAARTVDLRFRPVMLDATAFRPLRLAGAWQVDATDSRFGGVSALALDGGKLIALTDAGSLLRFDRPGGGRARVHISSLPATPGPAGSKRGRDSEAIARGRDGQGWWIAFEQRHSLFQYDRNLRRVIARFRLAGLDWPRNRGAEAIIVTRGGVLIFRESGTEVMEWSAGAVRSVPLTGAGPVADAARLPGGHIAVLVRRVSPFGFVNNLALLKRGARGYRLSRPLPLPLGRLANGEALAAEPLADGAVRLWLMTDNDFRPGLATLLVALDVPRATLESLERQS